MMKSLVLIYLTIVTFVSQAQNSFPLYSSGAYSGGSGDHTDITNAQLKLQATSGYVRMPHLSAHSGVSTVYNYEGGKYVYWGEPSDAGQYVFRGRDMVIQEGKLSVGGNVGIGTSSPLAKVSLRTSTAQQGLVISNSDNIGSQSHLAFTTADQPRLGLGPESYLNTYNNGKWNFNSANTSGTTLPMSFNTDGISRVIIKPDGNVGIGTESATHKLTIEGSPSTTESQVGIYNPSMQNGTVSGIRFHTGSGWNVMLRTRQDNAWLELTNNIGVVTHYWNGGDYFPTGRIAIGTTDMPGSHKLYVNGSAVATEVNVKLKSAWPDHVFKPDYYLMSINELENYIKEKGHLPEVPSENEVKDNGINVGEMNALLLKKIEELTLHLIEANKSIVELQKEVHQLKSNK